MQGLLCTYNTFFNNIVPMLQAPLHASCWTSMPYQLSYWIFSMCGIQSTWRFPPVQYRKQADCSCDWLWYMLRHYASLSTSCAMNITDFLLQDGTLHHSGTAWYSIKIKQHIKFIQWHLTLCHNSLLHMCKQCRDKPAQLGSPSLLHHKLGHNSSTHFSIFFFFSVNKETI